MFPQECFRLTRQAALLALISAAFPVAGFAASAGRVDFAVGEVTASGADGRARTLAKGSEVSPGETIVTGANGRVQIRFSDGAYSSLQPQTTFRIDEYQYAGQADGSEKGFFSLVKGALRTITGAIGRVNRNTYKVNTPTATIGIRGTEYLAREGNSLDVTVGEGLIEVCNAAGCIIIGEGESAYVQDPNTQPALTYRKTEIPAPPPGTFYIFRKGDEGFLAQLPPGTVFPGGQALLASGPGYSIAAAGKADVDGFLPVVFGPLGDGTATFSGTDLVSWVASDASFSGVPTGGQTDGLIGWGRWTSGVVSLGFDAQMENMHYVVGIPTPAADMENLKVQNLVGTYSLLGFTFPTAQDGTVGTQPVTGSLTANFGAFLVSYSLGVPIGGHNFALNGSASISGAGFTGFEGSVASSTGGCGGGFSCSGVEVAGIFTGAQAARAGMVYQFFQQQFSAGPQGMGAISGAATFSQTGLAPANQLLR